MHARRNHGLRSKRWQPASLPPRDVLYAWVSSERMGWLRLKPSELFHACRTEETQWASLSGKVFIQSLDRMRLFEGPLFSDGVANGKQRRNQLRLTITIPQGATLGWKYAELLRALKRLDEADLQWLLIARWLETEGVCRAEAFLPREILEQLLERASKTRIGLSPQDLYQARLIRIWLPYFTKLLADAKRTPKMHQGPKTTLLRMGYDENAVESALGKRSPLQASITWLASRGGTGTHKAMDEGTLKNAYSRVKVAKQKYDARFFKGIERNPFRIDPDEYHNYLHLIS